MSMHVSHHLTHDGHDQDEANHIMRAVKMLTACRAGKIHDAPKAGKHATRSRHLQCDVHRQPQQSELVRQERRCQHTERYKYGKGQNHQHDVCNQHRQAG